jgi:hypothetical protein
MVKRNGNVFLARFQKGIIRDINILLPYGMHLRQSRGDLCLFALNNPRTNPQHRFQCIRVFPCLPCDPSRDNSDYGFRLYCEISLTEIYIPSWRPYALPRIRSQDGDAESQAETGGDAESISGSRSRSRNLS